MRVGNSSLSEEVTQPVHLLLQRQGPESCWKGWDQPHPDCRTSEVHGSQEEGGLPWEDSGEVRLLLGGEAGLVLGPWLLEAAGKVVQRIPETCQDVLGVGQGISQSWRGCWSGLELGLASHHPGFPFKPATDTRTTELVGIKSTDFSTVESMVILFLTEVYIFNLLCHYGYSWNHGSKCRLPCSHPASSNPNLGSILAEASGPDMARSPLCEAVMGRWILSPAALC